MNKLTFASFVALLFASPVSGDQVAELEKKLGKHFQGIDIDSVNDSAIKGIKEVNVGPEVVYMTEDGNYLIQGSIYDISKEELVDLTEPRHLEGRVRVLDGIGEENMIIFGDDSLKHTITVFTDIDCGYCAKLHREMDQYNALGIRVRYTWYPRAGLRGESYEKALSVWCAEDRHKAMTDAKNGVTMPKRECDNPIEEQYILGMQLGIRGTPAIYAANGEQIGGYLPPKKMIEVLEAQTN